MICSFLALMLRKELEQRLEAVGHQLELAQIKQDLKALQQIELEEDGKRFIIRSQSKGVCWEGFSGCGGCSTNSLNVFHFADDLQ